MGMFSEIHNDGFAHDLLPVLIKAKDSNNETLIRFIKDNVFPIWENAIGEAWRPRNEIEKDITNFYENYI